MPRIWKQTLLFAGAAACAFLADLASKAFIFERLPDAGSVEVVDGFFRLRKSCNPGLVWGVFSRFDGEIVNALAGAAALAIMVAVLWMYRRAGELSGIAAAALGMVMGGAAGNLLDRVRAGSVRDFLEAYVRLGGRERSWPVFNAADAFICVGIVLLLASHLGGGAGRDGEKRDAKAS